MKVVSLFSGGGGLDLGLEASGFHSLVATDIDHHSCITLQQLNSDLRPFKRAGEQTIVIKQDIRNLDTQLLLKSGNLEKGETHLLAGGPPCQAFSVFGKRRGSRRGARRCPIRS